MKRLFRFICLLVSLLLLMSAWGGYVDPRRWALPAVLHLALPVVALAVGALALLMLALRQWRALGFMAAATLLAWPAVSLLAPLRGSGAVTDGETTFSMMAYNVHGFDLEGVTLRYILDQDADFVMLQETSLGPMDFSDLPQHVELRDELERKYPYHSEGYHDLAVLSKFPYTVFNDTTLRHGFGAPDDIRSEYHFYAKAFDLQVAGMPLTIINVHLQSIGLDENDIELYKKLTHNEIGTREQLSRVRSTLIGKLQSAYRRRAAEAEQLRGIIDDSLRRTNVIVCGDFNDTAGSFAYRTLRGDDLHDAFAECGRGPSHTYNRNRFYFKIDHVLYRGAMRAVDYRCDHAGASDHYPQVVTFALTGQPADNAE